MVENEQPVGPVDANVVPRFAGIGPAHATGTGTPEAGGMTSRELLGMLRPLSAANLVGADIVEVAPAYERAQLTAIAASQVAYEVISAMAPT